MLVVFDIGGSKMRVSVSENGRTLSKPLKRDTPQDYEEGVSIFAEMVREATHGEEIKAIAGGIPAVLSRDKSTLVHVHNLPGWTGKQFAQDTSRIFGKPVYVENDTSMVGFGELQETRYAKHGIAAYLTVSTGVGGSRFVDGRIDAASLGFEPGHQIIDITSMRTLEDSVSGTALERLRGLKAYEIPQEDEVWETLARELAVGLLNISLLWSPDIIILGGPMIVGSPAIKVSSVEGALREFMTIFPSIPEVHAARLEDSGGLHGSLAYLSTVVVD